jgi:hypothetical protein
MFLYKYLKQDGIDLLLNSRILVKSAMDLNDPFEQRPAIKKINDRELNDAYQKESYVEYLYNKVSCDGSFKGNREELRTRLGMININSHSMCQQLKFVIDRARKESKQYLLIASFCSADVSAEDDVLMWSHYSNNRGLRITFDSDKLGLPSQELVRVDYTNERITINPLLHFQDKPDVIEAALKKVLSVKSNSWEYEHEYRWFVSPALCSGDDNKYFTLPRECIVAVDVGINAGKEFLYFVAKSLARKDLLHVHLRQANVDDSRFKFNYDNINMRVYL